MLVIEIDLKFFHLIHHVCIKIFCSYPSRNSTYQELIQTYIISFGETYSLTVQTSWKPKCNSSIKSLIHEWLWNILPCLDYYFEPRACSLV